MNVHTCILCQCQCAATHYTQYALSVYSPCTLCIHSVQPHCVYTVYTTQAVYSQCILCIHSVAVHCVYCVVVHCVYIVYINCTLTMHTAYNVWLHTDTDTVYAYVHTYGVATVSRIDKIADLFGRISSFSQVSFAKETYDFIDATNRRHPIATVDCHVHVCITHVCPVAIWTPIVAIP